jgi:hypothetical protein
VRSSSRLKGQFKGRLNSSSEKTVPVGVLEPSQPIRLVGPGRRVGPVGLRGVQGTASVKQKESDPSELSVLLKEFFQVIVICCGW